MPQTFRNGKEAVPIPKPKNERKNMITETEAPKLNGASRWVPTLDDRATLEALKAEQDKETTAVEFVRNFLPFGPAKWSKILNALDSDGKKPSYFDEIKDPENLMAELRTLLDEIPLRRAQAERLNSLNVLELSKFRALKVAVDECRSKRTPERLVKFLAPTGGGKSMLCNYLARKCGAKVVESREAWKRSYITVLEDVSRALGLRLDGENRPTRIEDRLIEVFSQQNTVLAIDEGEYFGGQAINGIKLLLNKTRLVIVIAAIAEAHDRWNRYYKLEAEQLDRRTHAIVELSTIEPKGRRTIL
jgi:hypothetical protein